jgi:hypothetical protein
VSECVHASLVNQHLMFRVVDKATMSMARAQLPCCLHVSRASALGFPAGDDDARAWGGHETLQEGSEAS